MSKVALKVLKPATFNPVAVTIEFETKQELDAFRCIAYEIANGYTTACESTAAEDALTSAIFKQLIKLLEK